MGRVDGLIIPRSYNDYFSRSDPQAIRDLVAASTDDALSSTSENPVQNKVVNAALETIKQYLVPPTDAVLHYSFDEIPDYPDGTAVYYRNKNFTSVEDWSVNTNEETLSVDNSCLKIQSLGNRTAMLFINNTVLSTSNINGKIIKINFICNDLSSVYLQDNGGSYVSNNIFTVRNIGGNRYEAIGLCGTYTYKQTLNFRASTASANNYVVLEAIYIGNGSYSTPIIDNSGDNINAVNNGGIAVQGVCGKGVYFPSSLQIIAIPTSKIPAPTSNDDFAISCWVMKGSGYTNDTGSTTKGVIRIGATAGLIGIIRNGNRFGCEIRDNTVGSKVVTFTASNNVLYHIVAVLSGTTHTMKLYVNGVLEGETGAVTAGFQFGSGNTQWTIWGNSQVGGVAPTSTQQPAMLDDVMFFNRALSADEVTALYLNKANTPKYYTLADYKLAQLESAQTRSVTTEETPSEKKGTETQEEKKDEETSIEDEQQKEQPAEELKK